MFPKSRNRRLRTSAQMRRLVQDVHVHVSDFIMPLFVSNTPISQTIPFEWGRVWSCDEVIPVIDALVNIGIGAVLLFPVIPVEDRDERGSKALDSSFFLLALIRKIKETFSELIILSDIALDPYTSHGHDGICNAEGDVINDETISILAQMSLLHAQAGVDILAPSDLMDGRIGLIRDTLEENGYPHKKILSYVAKYNSCLYSPFRDILLSSSTLKSSSKGTYQMDYQRKPDSDVYLEALSDLEEGADILLVKPGLPYLDIISFIKQNFPVPVAAYHVSGECAMLEVSANQGFLDRDKALLEFSSAFKRAGADLIITYFAKDIAQLLSTL